jgi:hypothetical protein
MLQKVVAIKDNDGHWYVIPADQKDEFFRLLERGELTEDEFIEKFADYMTGGDLNLIQLYAEI